ncbi:MAG TPA: efflux RND transporter periplasmic adaptor subunit [Burkholderiales bacterium]|nr:efflux RND transporter periplasmic adaptor subunit [Burkholderiales bacterium]
MKRFAGMVTVTICAAAWALAGCAEKEKEAPPEVKIESHSVLIFPPGSPQVASIVSVPIEQRREMAVKFNGRLVWNEDRTVRVFAPFGGRVTGIAVRPGDRVKAGQTLAVLAAPELGVAQAEARKAEQDYGLAQKNLARIQELASAGVAPAKDLQQAQAELARAQAERARTQAKMKLYGKAGAVDQTLQLRTPIPGVVVERNLNPGQEVRPDSQGDKALFVVSDPTQLWFLLDVAEKDVGLVKAGTEVRLQSTSLVDEEVRGKVSHVADFVDPQTRSVKVRGTVEANDERLKAEMFVVGKIKIPAPGGFLVPARAVYLRGEQHYAFVDAGNGRYERRALKLGPLAAGNQVVLEGLAANDKVVVEGSLLLERILASKD